MLNDPRDATTASTTDPVDPNAPAVDPNAPDRPAVDPNAPDRPAVDPNAPDRPAVDPNAAAAEDAAAAAPSFRPGQFVTHSTPDQYGPEDATTTRYGFVVEAGPAEAGADPSYVVAWLPPGTAQLPAGDLTAV